MKVLITLFLTLLINLAHIYELKSEELKFVSFTQMDELLTKIGQQPKVTIILIPGILGSKLTISSKIDDKTVDTLMWGGAKTYDASLKYDSSQNVTATIFDKVAISNFFKFFNYNVYGNSILDLRDIYPDGRTRLEIFPYDWRQSNVKSAAQLQQWICARAQQLENRQIIFVAHSMGGLILKRWLYTHYDKGEKCDQAPALDQVLNVSRLFLVGTPQAGAPKFISALVDNYELLKDRPIIDEYLTWGLNKYGSSFESIYELIPIVQSVDCRRLQSISQPQYIYLRSGNTTPEPIDLFSAEVWQNLGIPKQRHTDDSQFYGTFLPQQLARAEKFLCDLWSYDFGNLKDKVTYVYGMTPKTRDTASKYILTRLKNIVRAKTWKERFLVDQDEIVIEDTVNDFGDGTVLKDIAARSSMPLNAHMGSNQHQALLDDAVFQTLLSDLLKSSKLTILKKASEDPAKASIIAEYASARNAVFAVGPLISQQDIFDSPSPEIEWVTRTNSQLLKGRSTDWKIFDTMARQSPDENSRAEAYAQIIADPSIPITKRLWSANNLGHLLIDEQNFSRAAQILTPAASALEAQAAGQFDKELTGKLYNNYGWASLKKGKTEQAEIFFTNAEKAGYLPAKNGLKEINSLRKETGDLSIEHIGRISR